MESIKDAIGEEAMKVITFNVSPDLVVTSPKTFHDSLRELIKDAAPVLEYLIIRDLSDRLGVHPERADSSLEEFIETARRAMRSGGMRGLEE